jgi:hypothetical protein
MVPYMRGLLQPLFSEVFNAAAIMQVRKFYTLADKYKVRNGSGTS